MKELQQAVWSVNSNLPLSNVRTLDQIRASSMAQTSFALGMLAIAAGVALLLGIVGIYGVIAYIAAQRTREIGIRMALGAQAADVSRLFVRHGLWLTGAGVALGVLAAVGLTRLMSSLLFGVSPMDPITYAAVSVALAWWRCWRRICRRGARRASIRSSRCDRRLARAKPLARRRYNRRAWHATSIRHPSGHRAPPVADAEGAVVHDAVMERPALRALGGAAFAHRATSFHPASSSICSMDARGSASSRSG